VSQQAETVVSQQAETATVSRLEYEPRQDSGEKKRERTRRTRLSPRRETSLVPTKRANRERDEETLERQNGRTDGTDEL
jgi:hypothetical protein